MDRSKLRSLLAKEGVSSDKKASFSEVETQFLTALRELMAATNLPKRLHYIFKSMRLFYVTIHPAIYLSVFDPNFVGNLT